MRKIHVVLSVLVNAQTVLKAFTTSEAALKFIQEKKGSMGVMYSVQLDLEDPEFEKLQEQYSELNWMMEGLRK